MTRNPIEPLNMEEALRLHHVIAPFMVEPREDETVIEYIQGMIDRIVEKDPGAYARSIVIMTRKTEEEILKMPSMEIFDLFLECLKVNQIVALYRFGKRVDYA